MDRKIIHHPHVILIHSHFSFSSQVQDGNIYHKNEIFYACSETEFLNEEAVECICTKIENVIL